MYDATSMYPVKYATVREQALDPKLSEWSN